MPDHVQFKDSMLNPCSPAMTTSTCRSASFHERACFGEIAFYDCEEGREAGGGGGASLHNAEEADLACLLFKGAVLVCARGRRRAVEVH